MTRPAGPPARVGLSSSGDRALGTTQRLTAVRRRIAASARIAAASAALQRSSSAPPPPPLSLLVDPLPVAVTVMVWLVLLLTPALSVTRKVMTALPADPASKVAVTALVPLLKLTADPLLMDHA
jgi:hypothetical protein